MIDQLFTYSISNKYFYEEYFKKSVNKEFINIITPKLNQNWKVKKDGIFFIFIVI